MRYNDTFIIAKDGMRCIAAAGAVALFFWVIDADLLFGLALVLLGLTLWVYRNPERALPHLDENSIVSVCDGKVKSIETIEDEAGMTSYQVVIKSSFFDTSLLRVPCSGKIKEKETIHGARLCSSSPLRDHLNEKSLVVFGEGEKQLVVLHTLELASVGIKNKLSAGQQMIQGSRYGLMVKGETMMLLPPESRVALKVGDKVRAGETLIGYFS